MALKYKLIASDNRGKEETTRLIFTVAGIPFEDVKLDEEEWSNMMPGECRLIKSQSDLSP